MSTPWNASRRIGGSVGAPVLGLLGLLVSLSLGQRAFGSSCTSAKPVSRATGTSIGLRAPSGAGAGLLADAVSIWNRCRDYGFEMPDLRPGARGSQDLVVLYRPSGNRTGRCGAIQGTVITLYATAFDDHHRPQRCGPLAATLAHEIGHFLGLRDAPLECHPHLMAPIARHGAAARTVDREICAAVSGLWRATLEPSPEESGSDRVTQESVAGR